MTPLLAVYAGVLSVRMVLKGLNLGHLRRYGHQVPPGFEGQIDSTLLSRTVRYTIDNSRLDMWSSVVDALILIGFLFGGLIQDYDRWILSLTGSFLLRGTFFFLGILYLGTILGIPFSLFRNFVIEKKYGFNTMTFRLWLSDFMKTLLLSTLIGGLAIMGALALIRKSPNLWWLWVWGFFLGVSLFLMYISPYVIEPLFFKFEPLNMEGLEERVRRVLDRAGLKVSRVFRVDASRRSRHSNAYFTGIGRVKRIVLFDTLLEQMNDDEVVAVLAHEAGHWKKRHVIKRLIYTQILSLGLLYAAFHSLQWNGLPELIGQEALSFYGRLLVLGFVFSLAFFPLLPLGSFLSRRDERVADRFAADLTGDPGALASALVILSKENLSNLHPHPVYAWFYYSHPPVVERVEFLRAAASVGTAETAMGNGV